MGIATINPTTGECLQFFDSLTSFQVQEKLERANRAYCHYQNTTFHQRSLWLRNAGAQLLNRENTQHFAQLITLEMGKPITQAIAEIKKCAWVCEYYAEQGETFLANELIQTDASESWVSYPPLGVVLGVMPWNFPFWQVFRFAAPALMAGNVVLVKHASNVPQCSLTLESIFKAAGFPENVFQTLLISSSMIEAVLHSPIVKAATLTGSEPAGASLSATAGKVIKKTVLELGGSDPFIVTESANIEEAVALGVQSRMHNSGQACIAAKRFIILEAVYERFTQAFRAAFTNLRIGDPQDFSTDIGPLATASIREQLAQQVADAIQSGAKCLIGGQPWTGLPGFFYEPTILLDLPSTAANFHEEFFGPVALLFRVPDLDHAIALANDSPFGLGASAWTQNLEERYRLIQELEAGSVFINGRVKSDPRLPFGGIKRSGYGRELGLPGIREFINIKTIWVK